MVRPLIGVTPFYDYEKRLAYIKRGYCEAIYKAGGFAAVLPALEDEELLDEALQRFDGFLISGGPDVDPLLYNEPCLPCNGEISPVRDSLETYVIRGAVRSGKPVLGICRGIQIMNVSLGGTLYQNLAVQYKSDALLKHSQEAPKWYPTHDILVEKGSRVWASFSDSRARVNSFHHQAVKEAAPGFKVTSRSPDGVIESLELEDHLFAVGVQWHPELMWEENPKFLKLFVDFVKSCGSIGV